MTTSTVTGTKWEADQMLNAYILDYLRKKNFVRTAHAFEEEAQVPTEPVLINAPEGFVLEWWTVFWDIFSARTKKPASDNAKAYVERQKEISLTGRHRRDDLNLLERGGGYLHRPRSQSRGLGPGMPHTPPQMLPGQSFNPQLVNSGYPNHSVPNPPGKSPGSPNSTAPPNPASAPSPGIPSYPHPTTGQMGANSNPATSNSPGSIQNQLQSPSNQLQSPPPYTNPGQRVARTNSAGHSNGAYSNLPLTAPQGSETMQAYAAARSGTPSSPSKTTPISGELPPNAQTQPRNSPNNTIPTDQSFTMQRNRSQGSMNNNTYVIPNNYYQNTLTGNPLIKGGRNEAVYRGAGEVAGVPKETGMEHNERRMMAERNMNYSGGPNGILPLSGQPPSPGSMQDPSMMETGDPNFHSASQGTGRKRTRATMQSVKPPNSMVPSQGPAGSVQGAGFGQAAGADFPRKTNTRRRTLSQPYVAPGMTYPPMPGQVPHDSPQQHNSPMNNELITNESPSSNNPHMKSSYATPGLSGNQQNINYGAQHTQYQYPNPGGYPYGNGTPGQYGQGPTPNYIATSQYPNQNPNQNQSQPQNQPQSQPGTPGQYPNGGPGTPGQSQNTPGTPGQYPSGMKGNGQGGMMNYLSNGQTPTPTPTQGTNIWPRTEKYTNGPFWSNTREKWKNW
eukprot:TRINITY_DN17490_c0_g1_i1.p1 TRINITY_DN17490_c0_g1~~TRINITY_DN17490_c0_g1_i1.p1  ORF type:complete len:673 (-),score=107.64 TRINITY_DN17490_c0_g1_i1:1155-3173(-)